MDTWATSSLTPQIAGGWIDDPDLFARVFPMDLRPQSHDIIRTWLFGAIVRSDLEHGTLPWGTPPSRMDPRPRPQEDVQVQGQRRDAHSLLERHGADAVRYWAASARPGVDTAFDESQMKIGRRLATKLLNVTSSSSRWANRRPTRADRVRAARPGHAHPAGRLIEEATGSFEGFDYARALERTEAFFWWFCDDHVELVKSRAYGARGDGPPARPRRAAHRPRRAAAAARPVPPVRDRRGLELVAHRLGPPRAVARPAEVAPTNPADPAVLDAVGEVLARVRRAHDRGQAVPAVPPSSD